MPATVTHRTLLATLAATALVTSGALAQTPASTPATGNAPAGGDDMAEVAKKLNNPVASLISVPFQNNFDFGGGPDDDGFQYKLNLQPVIPIDLNEDWKHSRARSFP